MVETVNASAASAASDTSMPGPARAADEEAAPSPRPRPGRHDASSTSGPESIFGNEPVGYLGRSVVACDLNADGSKETIAGAYGVSFTTTHLGHPRLADPPWFC